MIKRGAPFVIWALIVGLVLGYGAPYAFTPIGLVVVGICLLLALFVPIAGESQVPVPRARRSGDTGGARSI